MRARGVQEGVVAAVMVGGGGAGEAGGGLGRCGGLLAGLSLMAGRCSACTHVYTAEQKLNNPSSGKIIILMHVCLRIARMVLGTHRAESTSGMSGLPGLELL